MHDILIGGLIAIIVIAQILVALNTSKKIALFKAIVPKENSFETVKVFIPENQIKTIKIETIFENLEKYKEIPVEAPVSYGNYSQSHLDSIDAAVIEDAKNKSHFAADEDFPDEEESDYDDDTDFSSNSVLITIVKGNKVKRIDEDDLQIYLDKGWSRHNY